MRIYARPGYLESPSARRAGRVQGLRILGSYTAHAVFTLLLVMPFTVTSIQRPKQVTRLYFTPPPPENAPEPQPESTSEPRLISPVALVAERPKEPAKPLDERDVQAQKAELRINDPDNVMPQVLTRRGGGIAFGDPKDKDAGGIPFARYFIHSGTWELVPNHNGKISLDDFDSYETTGVYPLIGQLRGRFGVPADYKSYLVFVDDFNEILMMRIRKFAAAQGIRLVSAAVINFSLRDEAGIVVVKVTAASAEGDRQAAQ